MANRQDRREVASQLQRLHISQPSRGGTGVTFNNGANSPSPKNLSTASCEDNLLAKLNLQPSQASLPHRPSYGTQGKQVILRANYFELDIRKAPLLHLYHIDFIDTNRPPGFRERKRIIQLLLTDHLTTNQNSITTDFRANLISIVDLGLQVQRFVIPYRNELEDDGGSSQKTRSIKVEKVAAINMRDLHNILNSTQAPKQSPKLVMLQALNIIMGHHPKSNSANASVGASRHFQKDFRQQVNLGEGLKAIRGFFQSVRPATARILVNIQVKHAAFYQVVPLPQLMQIYLQGNKNNLGELQNFLKKLVVETTHIKRLNKAGQRIPQIRTIFGLANRNDTSRLADPPIVSKFGAGPKEVSFFLQNSTGGNGQYITVYEYFKKVYNITLQRLDLPVIDVGTKESPSYLPSEICQVMAGQCFSGKLSPTQTQNMIKFAVRKPNQNIQSIISDGTKLLGINPVCNIQSHCGIHVNPNMISVPGRVLTCPIVYYSQNKKPQTRNGSWNMANVKLIKNNSLNNWACMVIREDGVRLPWQGESETIQTLRRFSDLLKQSGVVISCAPNVFDVSGDVSTILKSIEARILELKSKPKLLLILLSSDNKAIYGRIKNLLDVKLGVLNVNCQATRVAKLNSQYAANVAMKINLKLGGQNHRIDSDQLGIVGKGKTMVVGLDVVHPPQDRWDNAPSIAGIVASVDASLAQWPGECQVQTRRQEMITGLEQLLLTRLKIWYGLNKSLPENILVYRDGVSEGQYQHVIDTELRSMKQACKKCYSRDMTEKSLPHITIIIVGKRHETRFFPTNTENASTSGNPINGTVVDRGITEACNWDFWLQAHHAIQGTARPAHYYVVHDEIFRKNDTNNVADLVESLTHNLCYLYGRATKAVSICTPAYYADLLCDRAREWLNDLYEASIRENKEPPKVTQEHVTIRRDICNAMIYI